MRIEATIKRQPAVKVTKKQNFDSQFKNRTHDMHYVNSIPLRK